MNMLRYDDFIKFFKKKSLQVIYEENIVDDNLLGNLKKNKYKYKLREKYFKKSNINLSTESSWFILKSNS